MKSRQADVRHRVMLTNFGPSIGIHLPTTTLSNILRHEKDLRKAFEVLPESNRYMVNCRNEMVEELKGEAASVDLEQIEPELVEIREICAQHTLDDIFNCDETGVYLAELDSKLYTILPDTVDALKPFVIAKNFARDVEEESANKMITRTNKSGWMTGFLSMELLRMFEDQLRNRPFSSLTPVLPTTTLT
ncbi:hypothetical protein EDD21DRAFT_432731 [Dissophora ornata]|nr:hypothetical protein EDD21DRAFT_432731 [Dissophora ornata]